MNRKKIVGGTSFRGFPKTSQRIVEQMELLPGVDSAQVSIARVTAVYPDRMACDVESSNGLEHINVPILTRCGLEADEVWGELELPSIDSRAIVLFIEGKESFPVIIGTLYPYAYSKYQKGQTTVNSVNKAFTKKILEDVDPKVYRKVFKGGTTIEVQEDGTLIIEAPSGAYIQLDEANNKLKIEDANGNTFSMETGKVVINGNLEVLQ